MLRFRQLSEVYSIVRLSPGEAVPALLTGGEFTSISRTSEELSIVCSNKNLPAGVDPGPPWICFKLEGPFPFSQTGVLLSVIDPLSKDGIPIFAVSTYDTDYVLIPQEYADRAIHRLREAGHELLAG